MEKKLCKHCKSEIDKKAKVCPNCRKKQGMGEIGMIILFILVIGFIVAVVQGVSTSDNKEEVKTISIGEKITIDDVDYTVDEKIIQKELKTAGGYMKYTADGNYLLIKTTITNNSKKSINVSSNNFRLKDENGASYAASILISVDDMDMFNFETINPNATESGYIAYDVANNDLGYTLTINGDSWLSYSGIEVKIQ